MKLASRFSYRSPVLRSDHPLSDDQIRTVAPSIFAETPHESRSQRYSYIPTAAVLTELRNEGFQPFMVCQTRVRHEDRRDYTKHMLRLRHESQINGTEANEIILLNSHDGTSSYQMLAGMFRFVCQNGLVCGDTFADVRVPHKGNVTDHVIEGAYEVLQGFEQVQHSRDAMGAITLDDGEAEVFARSALTLKYDDPGKTLPITESQVLRPRRFDDNRLDLWSTFNRVQENLVKGGLTGRTANGRQQRTRPVQGIDQNVRLNRALWLLALALLLNRQFRGADRTTDVLSFPLWDPDEELPDGMAALLGDLVVCPANNEEVIRTLAYCYAHDIPVTPRGAGTGRARCSPRRRTTPSAARTCARASTCSPSCPTSGARR